MGLFDNVPEKFPEFPAKELDNKVVILKPEELQLAREVVSVGRALHEAGQELGVKFTTEDIRAFVISMRIDKGKNQRMADYDKPKEVVKSEPVAVVPVEEPKKTYPPTGITCGKCGAEGKKGKKFKPTSPDYYCPSCGAVAWKSAEKGNWKEKKVFN